MSSRTGRATRPFRAPVLACLAWLAAAMACGQGEGGKIRAPEIAAEPEGQVVREGGQATFAATFVADQAPALQWERAEPGSATWAAIPGATSAAFTTPPATPGDHGARYRVRATNEGGTVTSSEAVLEVIWLHLEGPADVVRATGVDAAFAVELDARPEPVLQWEILRPEASWEIIPGATSASYVFPAPAPTDDGTRFRVVAESAFGVVPSAEATLTVIAAPVITLEPSDLAANEGSQVTFTAAASGLPAPSLRWERLAPGGADWAPIPGATSSSCTTTPVAVGDLGARYRLVATNAVGTATSRGAELTVRWLHLLGSPADVTVPEGTDASFEASFEGNPTPELQWQRAAPGGPWTDVAGATSPSYTIRATLSDEGTRLRAVAESAFGVVTSAEATLTVFSAPAVVSFAAAPARVTVGGSTSLAYEFTEGAGTIDGVPVAGQAGAVPVAPDTTRTYTLTVTGAYGLTATAQTTVTVYPAPVIVSFQAAADHVPPGSSASLVAEFDAGPEGTASVDRGIGAVQSGVAAATGPITSATTFTLTVTNGAGTSVSATAPVALGIDVRGGESIQAAIDQATPGTTIHLEPGIYSPQENAEAFLVFRPEKNGVVLRGAGASPGEVVLDGQDRVLHVVFYDTGIDASTRLENLTITRGYAVPDEVFPGGLSPVLRPEISQTILPESDFYHDGAGIMLFAAAPTIDGVVIRDGVSSRCAGGISVFARNGQGFPAVGPVIRNSEFHANQAGIAGGGGIGGAIDVYNGARATIVNDLFVGNAGWGGQVAVLGQAVATIQSSTFDGAGVASGVLVGAWGTATVLDTIFVNQTQPGLWPIDVQSDGSATISTNLYWNFDPGWAPLPGSGIVADPLLAAGARGSHYLSQTAAGQPATSPAVDAGSGPATDIPGRTTRTDGVVDEGVIDLGFHYAQ